MILVEQLTWPHRAVSKEDSVVRVLAVAANDQIEHLDKKIKHLKQRYGT